MNPALYICVKVSDPRRAPYSQGNPYLAWEIENMPGYCAVVTISGIVMYPYPLSDFWKLNPGEIKP